MKEMIERGLVSSDECRHYKEHSYQHVDPSEEGVNRAFSIARKIPEDIVSKRTITRRNASEVREKLEPFVRAGASQIVLYDVSSMSVSAKSRDWANSMREMSKEI